MRPASAGGASWLGAPATERPMGICTGRRAAAAADADAEAAAARRERVELTEWRWRGMCSVFASYMIAQAPDPQRGSCGYEFSWRLLSF
jgi:hypothetical protein